LATAGHSDRRIARSAWAVLTLALFLAQRGIAAEKISVEADHVSYDEATRSVEAEGNVRLEWKGGTLEADRLRVEQSTRRILSEGPLRLTTPELRLVAGSCDLDVDDETGRLTDVSMSVEDLGVSFGGREVRKYPGARYTLRDGYYTTCRSEEGHAPDWSLGGRDVDVDVGGYGKLRHGTFRVKDVPVLYLPYVVFPAHDDRQSGILLPQLGASSQRGFVIEQPYFWAIDKHQDLTLTGAVETAARIGINADYRYRPRRDVAGELEGAYYNEKIRGNEEADIQSPLFEGVNIPENRWMLGVRHRQQLRPNMQLYGDGLVVSDELYLREIDPMYAEYMTGSLRRTLRYTVNRGGVLARRGFSSIGLRSIAYQDFVDSTKQTLHRPGEAWATLDGDVGGIGYVVDGEFTRFERQRGADGFRMDASAMVSRDLTPRTPLVSNVWLRGRISGYQLDQTSVRDENGQEVDELDEYAGRAVAETGVDLRTAFAREFSLPRNAFSTAVVGPSSDARSEEGQQTMLHMLEPFTGLRFTSSGDDDQVPLYDEYDRIDDRTTFTYGVAQRFLFRATAEGQREERARLSIAQTYNLDDKVIDDHFSDVDLSMGIKPVGGVSVSGLTSYNPGASELTGAVGELSVGKVSIPYLIPDGASLDVVYRFVRGGEDQTGSDLDDLETLEARALFQLTPRLAMGLNGRYDFPGNQFVESGGGFRVTSACDCWAIDLGVVNRVNPDETQVRLAVHLKGLGGLGSSALEYQTPGLAGVEHGRTIYGRYGW
jgi:LPS-assembly protein